MSQTSLRSPESVPLVSEPSDGLNMPERIAFFILLVIVGVRPLVGESYETALTPIVPLGMSPTGPGPVFPLTMGSLVLMAAVLVAAGRLMALRPRLHCWGGFAIGLVLSAVGMVFSLFVASNCRLALNASSDWLAMIVLCMLLVWLLRRPWQVRLLLCVLIATGAAFAAQCVLQHTVEFRDTITEYQARKAQFWAAQNISPEDARVQLYERRLFAREATGYFPHSNVAGSYLMLAAWATAALAIAKLAGAGGPFHLGFGVLTAIFAALLFGCILLTGSRGAMLAGVVTAVLAVGWAWLMPRLRWGWQRRLLCGWLVVLAVAGAVVLYARQAPSRTSMGFRWDYWANTTQLLRDYFWTGVGAQNFGRFYLEYKPVTDPEEIRDPHNFFLTAFSQWGVIGAAAFVAMGLGVSICLSRSMPFGGDGPSAVGKAIEPTGRSLLRWFVGLVAGIFILRVWTVLGNPVSYLFYVTVVPLIVWCVAFATVTLERDRFAFWSDLPISPATGFVLLAGVMAFLLHGMIDMAVFYPGTAVTFFAVLAAALAIRFLAGRTDAEPPANARAGRGLRFVVLAAVAALWVAHVAWLWLPAAAVQVHLAAARRLVSMETGANLARSPALAEYRAAIRADALDPTPPTEAAEWLLGLAAGSRSERPPSPEMAKTFLDEAVGLIHEAATRDPQEIGIFRTKTSIYYVRAERFGNLLSARAAVGAAANAVNLYPASPQDRVLLAETIVAQAGLESAEARPDLLQEAIEQYEQALQMDAARPGAVELRRWSARVRQELMDRVDELRSATSQPASQPTTQSTSQPTSQSTSPPASRPTTTAPAGT